MSLLRSRLEKAPTPWTNAHNSPRRFVGPSNRRPYRRVKARPAEPRCSLHFGLMTKRVPFIVAALGRTWTPSCCTSMRRSPRKNARMISERTRDALAKAKQRGVVLGNPNVGKMKPKPLRLAMPSSSHRRGDAGEAIREIAQGLTNCNVPTPRGGDVECDDRHARDEAAGHRQSVTEKKMLRAGEKLGNRRDSRADTPGEEKFAKSMLSFAIALGKCGHRERGVDGPGGGKAGLKSHQVPVPVIATCFPALPQWSGGRGKNLGQSRQALSVRR